MPAPNSTIARLAWRNVIRNWQRSLASSLAIAAGFTAVSLFDGFLIDIRRVTEDGYSSRAMLADVLIQHKDAENKLAEDMFLYSLTRDEQEFLDKVVLNDPDVATRVRFLEVKGMISNGRNNAVFVGNSHDIKEGFVARGEHWQWNTIAGKPLHLMPNDNAVLIGMSLGLMMDCTTNVNVKTVTQRGGGYLPVERPFHCDRPRLQLSASTEAAQVNALDLDVAGLMDAGFREADKYWVQLPLATAQRLLDTDKITLMSVRLKDSKRSAAFIDRMNTAFTAAGRDFDIKRWQDHNFGAFMRNTDQILNAFRGLFMSIVIIIVVLSVANTMMKAVNERIREIGTLRSMGFHRSDIRKIFTLEGFGLAFVSCAGGLALTLILSLAVNFSGIRYKAGMLSVPIFLTVGMNPMIWLTNSIWLCLLAASTAWFSSRRAAKMTVADALRAP